MRTKLFRYFFSICFLSDFQEQTLLEVGHLIKEQFGRCKSLILNKDTAIPAVTCVTGPHVSGILLSAGRNLTF